MGLRMHPKIWHHIGYIKLKKVFKMANGRSMKSTLTSSASSFFLKTDHIILVPRRKQAFLSPERDRELEAKAV